LSEFVKHIVEQVLQRNSPAKDDSPPARPSSVEPASSLPANIGRPNYQREKSKQRLSLLFQQGTVKTETTDRVPLQMGKQITQGSLSRNFLKDSLPSLARLSLVQGNHEPKERSLLSTSGDSPAQLIGKTRNGTYVWFYPDIHDSLPSLLDATNNRDKSMGVVTANTCFPGQLFLVEDVMQQAPELEYQVTWEKEPNRSFVLKLFGNDRKALESTLKEIYLRFQRQVFWGIESHVSVKPSALLVKHLGVAAEAAGVLEGISYFNSIGLLDRFFKSHPDIRVQFQVEQNYLLLQGDKETVAKAINELRLEADRLL
jgi:hypothetical protein